MTTSPSQVCKYGEQARDKQEPDTGNKSSEDSFEEIKAVLTTAQDWEGLNAYEKTKRCCEELTRRGESIPAWNQIRIIIGGGSATDINRGKTGFRREHGAMIRRMTGFLQGVPDSLSPHILGLWSAAIDAVRQEFDAQVRDWQAKIRLAEDQMIQAEEERDQEQSRAAALEARIVGMQEAMTTLQALVETERAARDQAERIFEVNRKELAEQRDELRAALNNSKIELDNALVRLEGLQKHSLMEIERARTEAKKEIALADAEFNREREVFKQDKSSLLEQLRGIAQEKTIAKNEIVIAQQKLEFLTQDNESLRKHLERATEQVNQLTAENARMSGELQIMNRRRIIGSRRLIKKAAQGGEG